MVSSSMPTKSSEEILANEKILDKLSPHTPCVEWLQGFGILIIKLGIHDWKFHRLFAMNWHATS